MNRKYTNIIRFIIDEIVPPIIRDSKWFIYPFFRILYKKEAVKDAMDFKSNILSMSQEELAKFDDPISCKRESDLTKNTITEIMNLLEGDNQSIADIGCGNGFLLNLIKQNHPDKEVYGIDLTNRLKYDNIKFLEGDITKLPFADNHFDVVISTHTIEHVIPLENSIKELLRVTKNKLIIITPCQRYYYYTLDSHVNFFANKIDLLRYLPRQNYTLKKIDSDWFYAFDKINIKGS